MPDSFSLSLPLASGVDLLEQSDVCKICSYVVGWSWPGYHCHSWNLIGAKLISNAEAEPSHYSVRITSSNPMRYIDQMTRHSLTIITTLKMSLHHTPTSSSTTPPSLRDMVIYPIGVVHVECPLKAVETLQNHPLNWHEVDTRSNTTRNVSQQANYVEHAIQNIVVVPWPPAHDYTAVKAVLFRANNPPETICVDSRSTTTFIN